jgi:hypothetical protein
VMPRSAAILRIDSMMDFIRFVRSM